MCPEKIVEISKLVELPVVELTSADNTVFILYQMPDQQPAFYYSWAKHNLKGQSIHTCKHKLDYKSDVNSTIQDNDTHF